MTFRKYRDIASTCAKTMRQNIDFLVKQNIAHLMPPQNFHSYEHGLKVNFKDVEQKERNTDLVEHESSAQILISSVKDGNFMAAVDFIDSMAESMASTIAKTIFKKLEEVTTETGNRIDGKGMPLTGDQILKGLEMTGVSVDRFGQVSVPRLITNPSLQAKFEEIQSDPEFKRKFDEIYQRKAREAFDIENERKSKFPKRIERK